MTAPKSSASDSAKQWEVEQKFTVSNPDELAERLRALGFSLQREEQHSDLYFRHPCRDFRSRDEAFRLREVNGALFVTYKGPRLESEVKTRREIELGLIFQESPQWKELLGNLGFEALPEVQKTRRIYFPPESMADLQGFVVTQDDVRQLGTFAEIELVVADESELKNVQQRILHLAEELKLTHTQPLSYLTQLLEKLGLESS